MPISSQVVSWIDNDRLAIILMIVGCLFFSGGFIFANEQKMHPIITGLTRGFSLVCICCLLSSYYSLSLAFKSTYILKWQVIRNGIMVIHGLAYTWVQFYLPLPIAITLGNTSPIFIYVYDYYLYGITINRKQFFFLIISVIGVILAANGSYFITIIDEGATSGSSKF